MKRYILFYGQMYYPTGGWYDKAGDFDTIEDARSEAFSSLCDWYHIVDTNTWTIVDSDSRLCD